jgi:hypothetical protein
LLFHEKEEYTWAIAHPLMKRATAQYLNRKKKQYTINESQQRHKNISSINFSISVGFKIYIYYKNVSDVGIEPYLKLNKYPSNIKYFNYLMPISGYQNSSSILFPKLII